MHKIFGKMSNYTRALGSIDSHTKATNSTSIFVNFGAATNNDSYRALNITIFPFYLFEEVWRLSTADLCWKHDATRQMSAFSQGSNPSTEASMNRYAPGNLLVFQAFFLLLLTSESPVVGNIFKNVYYLLFTKGNTSI